MNPRLLTEADIPWIHRIAQKRYRQDYDITSSEGWFRNIVLKGPLMFYPARTDNAFLIAMLSTVPWAPTLFECNVIFVCADNGAMWEALTLMRASIDWARKRRCWMWRVSSDTDVDLEPLARRVGCTEMSPRYVLKL